VIMRLVILDIDRPFGLDLYQRRLLIHEVIGPGIMVCVIFDHYNLQIYASNSFHF
jgi:hypothetical protein